MPVLVVPAAVLGLVIGSFLNVVVRRVPRAEPLLPRSACPACGHRIRPRDTVPVLSWLLLRARCRDCGARISGRYPAVEALTAVLFAAAALLTGWSWALPALLHLVAVGVALAAIDLDVHRLPDRIVLPATGAGVVLLALASWNPGAASDWPALLRGGVGGAGLLAVYLAIALVRPGGMGLGDVKLAGLLGLHLGWAGYGALVVGGFAAFLLGGLVAIGLLLARRAQPGSGIPFGPWMLAGAGVGLVVGEPVWAAYLALLR